MPGIQRGYTDVVIHIRCRIDTTRTSSGMLDEKLLKFPIACEACTIYIASYFSVTFIRSLLPPPHSAIDVCIRVTRQVALNLRECAFFCVYMLLMYLAILKLLGMTRSKVLSGTGAWEAGGIPRSSSFVPPNPSCQKVTEGAPFAHRIRALIYSATKIITAVKIPLGAFIDRRAPRPCREAWQPLR
jgi:hypothetical protein